MTHMLDKNLSFGVLIPARFDSSRFPGKPLALIYDKPMLQHVYENCAKAVGPEKVYVATDDSRISCAVHNFGGQYIMTSSDCLTGTDRLAEANKKLDFDFVINVQGDEPLVSPKSIRMVIDQYLKSPGIIVNAMCAIRTKDEFMSANTPKVVFSLSGRLCYISRGCVPSSKERQENKLGHKQVCIYAFSKQHLNFFLNNPQKTPLERIEDIEILRFVENDVTVQMIDVGEGSIAVDVAADINKVKWEIQRRKSATH